MCISMNHTLISPVSYVDVSAVCVCAVPLEMVCLLCVGSVVYWSIWGLTTFRVWRAVVGGVGGGHIDIYRCMSGHTIDSIWPSTH